MSLSQILLYSTRAAAFALMIGALWCVFDFIRRKGRNERFDIKSFCTRLLLICYLAALIQITVIRNTGDFLLFLSQAHSWLTVQPIPFDTTIAEFRRGLWPFCYHVVGNMIWFVPLGLIGPLVKRSLQRCKKLIIAAICLSLGIELAQWIFATGMSDIDDIILNALGALVGWIIWHRVRRTTEDRRRKNESTSIS
jgi:glycopeptide antibiotics resistance protein